jgi:putative transposase
VTPEQLHYGLAQGVYDNRRQVSQKAFNKASVRFKGKVPAPPPLPQAVWINKPKSETLESNLFNEVFHFH